MNKIVRIGRKTTLEIKHIELGLRAKRSPKNKKDIFAVRGTKVQYENIEHSIRNICVAQKK